MNNSAFKAILVTKGRKTGKEHSVWLRAVRYNEKLYFSRHKADGDWIKNAIENPEVKVEFDNSSFSGKAILVSDEKDKKRVMTYDSKGRAESAFKVSGFYGMGQIQNWERGAPLSDYLEAVEVEMTLTEI